MKMKSLGLTAVFVLAATSLSYAQCAWDHEATASVYAPVEPKQMSERVATAHVPQLAPMDAWLIAYMDAWNKNRESS
jgi:hypothetical protein